MVNSFTSVFGGDNVDPTYLSYAEYETDVDLALVWAFEADDDATVMAAKIGIDATEAGLEISLPDAQQVSVGRDVLIRNIGTETFAVLSASGVTLGTVASGEAWYFYLTDNTTLGGTWTAVEFGAGTSSASAASLAGAGLVAVVSLLNQNLPINPQPSGYAPGVGDLATVLLHTGGAVTYSPVSAATLTNGWFVWVINGGSGSIVWTPGGGQLIDGAATKTIDPTESALFFSDGANFWSAAYGRAIVNAVSAVAISVTAVSSPLTLSSSQAAAQVQDYTGTLAANLIVNYGTGVGFWFVRNNTSGAYSLTLRVNGSDAGVAVAQGSYSILRSNGSTMAIAFTATSGTVTQINTTSDLTGGPITTTGTIGLADTAVTPGAYGGGLSFPTFAVSQKGRLTTAGTVTLGSAAALTAGAAAGNVPVLNAYGLLNPVSGGVPTGTILDYIGLTAPGGYVFGNATTIGNAASAATGRANADTEQLFTLLWNSFANAQAPVLPSGRGASAAADFAANKTIGTPDLRGRLVAGLDDNGGVAAASRLTSPYIDGATPGAVGGTQSAAPAVTVTGTGTISGTTSGTLSVTGSTGGPSDFTPLVITGPTTSAPSATHTHVIAGTASGSLTVGGTCTLTAVPGTVTTFGILSPMMVASKIVKL